MRLSRDAQKRGSKGRETVSAAVIDDIEIARALHVVFVAHWIGGVAFVTLVALPLARSRGDAAEGWALFEAIESRFAAQVRWSIPLAGATGLWMTFRLGLWATFGDLSFWWMDAMALLWALFMAIVFVVQPLAHKRIAAMAPRIPRRFWRGCRASTSSCSPRASSRSSARSPARMGACSTERGAADR